MLNVPSEKSMDKLLANIHQDKIITASTIGKCLDMFFYSCLLIWIPFICPSMIRQSYGRIYQRRTYLLSNSFPEITSL